MTAHVSVCVRSLHRCSSDICIIINHTNTHTDTHTPCLPALLWPLPLFYGLTCHDRGMTATFSQWEERKWEKEGTGDVVSERMEGEKRWVSVEKERGDERQIVKQVHREGREGVRKKDNNRPDVLTLHVRSAVQWVQCEKFFTLVYVFSLFRVQNLHLEFARCV